MSVLAEAAPAFCTTPAGTTGNDLDLVLDFCEAFGLPTFDGFQRTVVQTVTARDTDGQLAREAAVLVTRQSGKTFGVELLKLARAYTDAVPLTIWSAHKFKSTKETYRRLRAYILGTDPLALRDPAVKARRRWLEADVLRMPETNGEEMIELRNGARIVFMARSAGAGRAFSADDLVLDEAYALTEDMAGDIVPTMAARIGGQTLYLSSHPHRSSTVLRGIRDRGRAGDPSLAYVEYRSQPGRCALGDGCDHSRGVPGCQLDDPAAWAEANPSLRITDDAIRHERRTLTPLVFARERLGWDDDPAAAGDDPVAVAWGGVADRAAEPVGPPAAALDASPDGMSAAIVVCAAGADGVPVVQVVAHQPGTEWVVAAVLGLQRTRDVGPVGVDKAGPAGALVSALDAAGAQWLDVSGPRSTQACGAFANAVAEGAVRHRGQRSLDDAVAGARRRPVGDAWKWSRKDSTADISPLVAATIARHVWAERGDPDPQVILL